MSYGNGTGRGSRKLPEVAYEDVIAALVTECHNSTTVVTFAFPTFPTFVYGIGHGMRAKHPP